MTGADRMLAELSEDLDGGYGAFVRAHADTVYCAALRLCRSPADAEDIAQETFVRAYRSLQRFEPARLRALEARPWLLTITLNLWRNRLRAAGRRPRTTPDTHAPEAVDLRPGPHEAAERSETSRALVRLLETLPERQRVAVVLHHVVGLSYPEVAAVLACPVGTAKASVARGLERLRQAGARPEHPEEK
ncbi:MAG: RNA polymerase sigma factor [Acidimicrobiales bacterium]